MQDFFFSPLEILFGYLVNYIFIVVSMWFLAQISVEAFFSSMHFSFALVQIVGGNGFSEYKGETGVFFSFSFSFVYLVSGI